ncbi:hypothetical protein F7R06_15020 [Pseudomonas moorei]|nr:hypothetical protein F7R06_15020 [Pseudomonas moorei]
MGNAFFLESTDAGNASPCRSEPAPGGAPTMDVNDDAHILNERVVQIFFASKLAPTGGAGRIRTSWRK